MEIVHTLKKNFGSWKPDRNWTDQFIVPLKVYCLYKDLRNNLLSFRYILLFLKNFWSISLFYLLKNLVENGSFLEPRQQFAVEIFYLNFYKKKYHFHKHCYSHVKTQWYFEKYISAILTIQLRIRGFRFW